MMFPAIRIATWNPRPEEAAGALFYLPLDSGGQKDICLFKRITIKRDVLKKYVLIFIHEGCCIGNFAICKSDIAGHKLAANFQFSEIASSVKIFNRHNVIDTAGK